MRQYLAVVWIVNYLVNFLLMLSAGQLVGHSSRIGRLVFAAAISASHASLCLLPEMRDAGTFGWRLAVLAVTGTAAFGKKKTAVQSSAIYILLSLAMGGGVTLLGRGALWTTVISLALICLLLAVGLGNRFGGKCYIPLVICREGRIVHLVALRDTGNELHDPVTGESVLVVDADTARELTGLTPLQLASPLETVSAHPIAGLRLIPYRAVGSGGMLLALRIPDVMVGSLRRSRIVAFSPNKLGDGNQYQALIGGM